MKHSATAFLLLGAVLLAAALPAWGREVKLGVGETYTTGGGLTVRCIERNAPRAITLTDCQFWDNFNKVCLYTRKTLRYENLACVEECQHWDSFNKVCLYATTCKFYPDQRAFVRTVCDVFDPTQKVCRQTKQKLIR